MVLIECLRLIEPGDTSPGNEKQKQGAILPGES